MPEQEPYCDQDREGAPLHPTHLPSELADFLRGERFACLTHATDRGTAFLIKAPGSEIERVRGRHSIGFRTELYLLPQAPVIRMVLTIYDQPDSQLALETFVN